MTKKVPESRVGEGAAPDQTGDGLVFDPLLVAMVPPGKPDGAAKPPHVSHANAPEIDPGYDRIALGD